MELTGKTRQDFEKWYKSLPIQFCSDINGLVAHLPTFYRLPESMQWGIYVDFFDSVGIDIEISKAPVLGFYYWMINDGTEENEFDTRPEARKVAIENANEIYNNYDTNRKS